MIDSDETPRFSVVHMSSVMRSFSKITQGDRGGGGDSRVNRTGAIICDRAGSAFLYNSIVFYSEFFNN